MRHRKTITIKKSREVIFEEAIARSKALEAKRRNEDEATANLPEPPQPTDWYPETRPRYSLFKAIIGEVINLAKI